MTTAKLPRYKDFSSFGAIPTVSIRRGMTLTPCRPVHVFGRSTKRHHKREVPGFCFIRVRKQRKSSDHDDRNWSDLTGRAREAWMQENSF